MRIVSILITLIIIIEIKIVKISKIKMIQVTRVSPGLVHYWRNALNRKKLFGVPKSRSVRYKTSLFCIIYMD